MKKRCCEKLKKLFYHPKSFFSEVEKEKSYSEIIFFYVKISLIAIILEFIFSLTAIIIRNTADLGTATSIVYLVLNSILSLGFAFALPFVYTAIVHLGILIFRGKQGFFNTYKPVTYAATIGIVYNLITIIIAGFVGIINSPDIQNLASMTPEMLWQNTGFSTLMIIYGIIMIFSLIHMLYAGIISISKFQKMSKLKAFFSIILIPLIIMILAMIILTIFAYYYYPLSV